MFWTTMLDPCTLDSDTLSHVLSFLSYRQISENVLLTSKAWNLRVSSMPTKPRADRVRKLSFVWQKHVHLNQSSPPFYQRDFTISRTNRIELMVWLYKTIESAKTFSTAVRPFSEAVVAFERMMTQDGRLFSEIMDCASVSFIRAEGEKGASRSERTHVINFTADVSSMSKERVENFILLNPAPPPEARRVDLMEYVLTLAIVTEVDLDHYTPALEFLTNRALMCFSSTIYPMHYPVAAFSVVLMFLFLVRLPTARLLEWENFAHSPERKWLINSFCTEMSFQPDQCSNKHTRDAREEATRTLLGHMLLRSSWTPDIPPEITTGTLSVQKRNEFLDFVRTTL
jgi:hypothetical protein